MEKQKILLVGVGGYGINYIQEMTEKNVTSAVIEGICEVMPNVKEVYPVIEERQIPLYDSIDKFYQEHKADIAVICTPIHLHYEQIRTCLLNGSNVLTEKPVCTSVEGAQKLIRLADEVGKFVSVGYQLNYSKDVLEMKRDILNGKFGKPVYMKAMHGMSRGKIYYSRNNWAGKIKVRDCSVNDSPFNNACAHQFQIMTFLLGKSMDSAAELDEVNAELYRGNKNVENFDIACVAATTDEKIPLYYYTAHPQKAKKLGPVAEYRFEKGTIYFGKDFGQGALAEYVAVMDSGEICSYADIDKGERLQKLYDTIDCSRGGGHPECTIQCAIPHLDAVNKLAEMPIKQIDDSQIDYIEEDGDVFCCVRNLEEIFTTCYLNRSMPSDEGALW